MGINDSHLLNILYGKESAKWALSLIFRAETTAWFWQTGLQTISKFWHARSQRRPNSDALGPKRHPDSDSLGPERHPNSDTRCVAPLVVVFSKIIFSVLKSKSMLRLTFDIICCTHAEVTLLYYWQSSCCHFLHLTSHSHASDGLCPQITILYPQLACAVLREAAVSCGCHFLLAATTVWILKDFFHIYANFRLIFVP
jgi:hypothetical protein